MYVALLVWGLVFFILAVQGAAAGDGVRTAVGVVGLAGVYLLCLVCFYRDFFRPGRRLAEPGTAPTPYQLWWRRRRPAPDPSVVDPQAKARPLERRDPFTLLQPLLDDPDDDARRLVLADWLEENGWAPEQAALVRQDGYYVLKLRGYGYLHWQAGRRSVRLGRLPSEPLCSACKKRVRCCSRARPFRWQCKRCAKKEG